ncbi:complement receptor type 1 [Eublepharis macularius]|uniref:Complement receptor type 1 n=1 Tax=Eublepharis macularius TaxID=481883 RepID=A0AA97L168_EUBMA|nr:complement receptor type 1 [Eublepharis macularius]
MPGSFPSSIDPKLFVLLSLLSGVRGDCGKPPKLKNAIPQGNVDAASFPTDTAVIYECLDDFYNIQGKLDVTTCLSNSQWSPIEEFCESSCPVPTSLKYAQPKPEEASKSYYTPGTTVTYVCRRGYDSIPGMSPVIICLQNNTWSKVPVFCKGKSCGDPGKPQNGRAVILTDLLYRAKVNFTCDDGYRLIGTPVTQCLTESNTVKWNKEPPDCQSITCSSPPNITGGTHDGGESFENFPYNSTITYKCNHGFSLIGEASIHCTTEDKIKGIWSGPAPECKGDCNPPEPIRNAALKQEPKPSYPAGTELTYTCISGYEYIPGKRPVIRCLDTSEWSQVDVFCQGKRCPTPDIENGHIVEDSELRLGDQITFACYEGYRPVGRTEARCILSGGNVDWNSRPPHCERVPCYPPPEIANGRHNGQGDSYTYGSAVTYQCDPEFSLIGNKTIVCTVDKNLNGKWSGSAPQCKVVKCRTPEVLNGVMITSYQPSYTYQDRVVFRCHDNFRLKDNRGDISCGSNSTWEPRLPECIEDIRPTTSSGGDMKSSTPAGPTTRSPIGSTVKPVEETTEIATSTVKNLSGNYLGSIEPTEKPKDESGSSVGVIVGAVVAVIAVIAITVGALIGRAHLKRRGKLATHSSPSESYTAVPRNTDISLEEKEKPVKIRDSCGPPTRFYFAELIDEHKSKTSFPVGSTVKYRCRPGYQGRRTSVTCLETLKWSEAPTFCGKMTCPNPGEPDNGRVIVPKDLFFGSTVNFSCDEGHRLIGQSSIRCIIANQKIIWSGGIPRCQRIPCYPPPDIPHGKHNGRYNQDYVYGDAVTYTCDKGYPRIGDAYIHCTTKDGENGVWSGHVSCGAIQCSAPQSIANGKYTSQASEVFDNGAFVEYSCGPGYKLIGEARIYCTETGSWSSPTPYCEVIGCLGPEIQNGRITSSKVLFDPREIITFECDPGYILQGTRVIQCQSNSTWDSPVPICVKVKQCQRPPNIQHGSHSNLESAVFANGMFVRYKCDPGYTLIGEKTIYCTTSGTWSPPAPHCAGSCGPPPNLNFAELTNEYKNKTSFPVGSIVKYGCRPGYYGFRTSVACLSNLTWSGIDKLCKKRSCENLGDVENGRVIISEDLSFGSTVNFTCEEGHKLIGQSFIRCVLSGQKVTWSGKIPFCQRIQCYPPPDIPHGKHNDRYNKDYFYGDAVTYTCDKGYPRIGDAYIHCTTKDGENGVWSGRLSCGVSQCPVPPDIANGNHNVTAGKVFTSYMSVTYFCDPGYSLIGKASISCTASGNWSLPLPHCEVQCSTPQRITNGKYTSQSSEVFTKGAFVEYSCDPGYHLIGEAIIDCTESGSWSSQTPSCEVVQCPSPPEILHGEHNALELAIFTNGKSIKYRCEPGYILIGEATIYCTASGAWSLPVPKCEVIQCQRPPKVQNGFHSNQESVVFSNGMCVKYTCEDGYTLIGEATIYCTESGTWNLPAPRCEETSCICPVIQNGRTTTSKLSIKPRETIEFECDPGYILEGNNEIQCQSDGTWEPSVPICVSGNIDTEIPPTLRSSIVSQCPSPPHIDNGYHIGEALYVFPAGTTVSYSCISGYILIGQESISCTESGAWSFPPPRCEVLQCTPPPPISNGEHDGHRLANFTVGTSVNYTCNPGYLLVGEASSHCTSSGAWSQPIPRCEVMRCPPPPRIVHGRYFGENFMYQTSVIYVCDAGYYLVGDHMVTCTLQGSGSTNWTEPPKCKGCLAPQEIANGKPDTEVQEDFAYGSSVMYRCDPGYFLTGATTIYCLHSGMWEPPVPQCKVVQCPSPPEVLHGEHSALESAIFTNGKSIKYICEPGYVLIGEATIYCMASGAWSFPVPKCEAKGCIGPEIQNGRKSSSNIVFKPMETITFECDRGYILKGNSTIQCQPDNMWDFPVPLCVREMQCQRPPELQNGFHSNQKVTVFSNGMHVKYTCEDGYTLIGEATIYCTESGTWNLPAPRCEGNIDTEIPPTLRSSIVSQCPSPPHIDNGYHIGEALYVFPAGTTVSYSCISGYILIGQESISCTESGAWSFPPPRCEVLQCTPPPPISNGEHDGHRLANFTVGTSVNYTCNPGYLLVGEASSHCTSSGAWSQPIPRCEDFTILSLSRSEDRLPIGCILPQIPGGKKAEVESVLQSGDNVTVECEDGYVLEGSSYVQCQHDFTWDPPVPVCKPVFSVMALISFGSVVGFLLLLTILGIIWMTVSKWNKVRYTPANSKEISDIPNSRISCSSNLQL